MIQRTSARSMPMLEPRIEPEQTWLVDSPNSKVEGARSLCLS